MHGCSILPTLWIGSMKDHRTMILHGKPSDCWDTLWSMGQLLPLPRPVQASVPLYSPKCDILLRFSLNPYSFGENVHTLLHVRMLIRNSTPLGPESTPLGPSLKTLNTESRHLVYLGMFGEIWNVLGKGDWRFWVFGGNWEGGGRSYISEKRFVLKIKFCTAYEILLFVYS